MNKKVWLAGVLALIVVIGAGCGQKPTVNSGSEQQEQEVGSGNELTPGEANSGGTNAAGGNQEQQGEEQNPPQDSANENDATKKTITVYYTDPEELELKQANKEISFKDETQKYEEAYKALQTSDDANLIPLWKKIELKKLDVKDGAITLDIHLPDEARLGAGGEQFALDALRKTMFQFDEVKSLDVLVDGAKVESLMGHVDLEHPMIKK